MKQDKAPYIDSKSPISTVECPAFNQLQLNDKLYAYHFTRACWAGAKICYFQRAYEGPGLFYLFYKIFESESTIQVKENLIKQGFNDDEIVKLYVYISYFFQNCGNFLSFGDTKFIPEVEENKFELFIFTSKAYQENKESFDQIWKLVKNYVFNYTKPYGLIDMLEKEGVNSYYSKDMKKEFIEKLDQHLHKLNISELNTRVVERDNEIEILVASAIKKDKVDLGKFEDKQLWLQYGDFSEILCEVVKHLREAQKYASNETQKQMLEQYIIHFETGDIEKHKESQRLWIQDKGPIIETNIGFIETYLDPMKVRAEFEGFVAIVNQDESKLLSDLVNKAEQIITYLPWPKEFEIEKFSRPDFTSLEVLAFACSGTPVGINIPNYDDIRQNMGFKNVNLGNVYGKPNIDNIRFIEGDDIQLFSNFYKESLFIIVALHELIGHGSGKLFMKDKDGKLNFDNVINPFTNEQVNTFYGPNDHWHARFGELSGAYEECKADAVALYLSTYDDVVQILLPGKVKQYRDDCVKAAWLDIIISAMKGLQYYSVEQSKWGQPHILASYVIFQALVKEDPNFITFKYSKRDDKDYFCISVAYEKIWNVGKLAIGKLLKGLQIYKSIGDGENGMKFFNQFIQVDDQTKKLREMVITHKTPRRGELQSDVQIIDNDVQLITFPENHEGVIQSHIIHYQQQVEDVKEIFLQRQQQFKN